jgi:hypothetical protein
LVDDCNGFTLQFPLHQGMACLPLAVVLKWSLRVRVHEVCVPAAWPALSPGARAFDPDGTREGQALTNDTAESAAECWVPAVFLLKKIPVGGGVAHILYG